MLQPLGVTLSHSGMLHLGTVFKGYFHTQIIDQTEKKKRMRLSSDNVDVKHELLNKHLHLEHWFGTFAIYDSPLCRHLPTVKSQKCLSKEPIETFFQNDDDVTIDYALIGHSIREGVTKGCLVFLLIQVA